MDLNHIIAKILQTTTDQRFAFDGEKLGLTYDFKLQGLDLNVTLIAGFPASYLELSFIPFFKERLKACLPSYNIVVHLDSFVRAHLTQLVGKGIRGVKNTIAVASGKGGVGKSTVTVNLACALAKEGARVGIIDADIYGPSIPLMLGKTQPVEVIHERYQPVSAYGLQAMSIGYLTAMDQALIWRGPMLAKSLLQMIDLTAWQALDYLFIDLPPGTGDIQLSLVQKIPLTGAVVVTTPQTVATLDAQKAIKMFNKTGIDVLGLVENMSSHVCNQCGHQEAIFGSGGGAAVCESFNIDFLGQWPLHHRIGSDCDSGTPTVLSERAELAESFIKTAITLSLNIAKKPINYADKIPPVVLE